MEPGQAETIDDRALLASIASGDRSSFQRFYTRYAGKVLGYLRQLTRNPGISEEITQEVFVSVWLKAQSYQSDRGDPAGWLYTITRNKLVDRWRRGDCENAADAEPVLATLSDRPTSIDVHLGLRQALSRLSEEQRRMLEMAYFGGLTYEETADALKLPVGTLKSRMRVALGRLRLILEGTS